MNSEGNMSKNIRHADFKNIYDLYMGAADRDSGIVFQLYPSLSISVR